MQHRIAILIGLPALIAVFLAGKICNANTYATWKTQVFNIVEQANPAISGEMANPSKDGIKNLEKYALGLDPHQSVSAGVPTFSLVQQGGNSYLALTFQTPSVDPPTDILYTPQSSPDLVNWSQGSGAVSLFATQGSRVTYIAGTLPIDTSAKAFMRLQVSETVLISLASGTYASAQTTSVAGPPNAVLYYTTDGSTPTNGSTMYTGSIAINSSLTLKVQAYLNNVPYGGVAVANYTVNLTPTIVTAIDCGSTAPYSGADGTTYAADTYFTSSSSFQTSAAIAHTGDSTLYQTARVGNNFTYAIPVPNGDYTVILKFSENAPYNTAGQRQFNVTLQGTQVLTNFDIFAQVGIDYALDRAFTATVSNGVLTLGFVSTTLSSPGDGRACVNAIVVETGGSGSNNQLPVADAGSGQTISLPTSSVNLTGTAVDYDGTIAGTLWTKTSGPAGGTIMSPSSLTTAITGLTQGIYVFRLTATDNLGATGFSEVQVTVNPAPGNLAPFVSAGSDRTIPLPPTGAILLTGWGADLDGTVTYSWTETSGNAVSFATPTAATSLVTGLAQGSYTFKLTVTDDANASVNASVNVTVTAPATGGKTVVLSPTASGEIYLPDMTSKNIQPGDTIVIPAGAYPNGITIGSTTGVGIHGSASNPVIIVNDSSGNIVDTNYFRIYNSTFFKITGSGSNSLQYGIHCGTGGANAGMSAGYKMSDYEVERIEIAHSDVGLFLDELPNPNDPFTLYAVPPNWTQKNVNVHDNYVHDTNGEGMYIGQTSPDGEDTNGVLPIRWENVNIHDNRVENTGWDGIQLSNARDGSSIHNNVVRNYGIADIGSQQAGIISGGNTIGNVYDNAVLTGTGNGIEVFGYGVSSVMNNVVDHGGTSPDQDSIYVNDIPIYEEVNPNLVITISGNTINQTVRSAIRNANYGNNTSPGSISNNIIYNAAGGTVSSLITSGAGDAITGNQVIHR